MQQRVYLREVGKNPQKNQMLDCFGFLFPITVNIKKQSSTFEEALALDPNHETTIEVSSPVYSTVNETTQ